MLFSVSLILLCGMFLGYVCKKIRLPSLVGMIATGIILGPYVFNILDAKLLSISAELRRIALVIILMRAGLSLDLSGLKKVGRSAVLMCFVPALFEILGYVIVAPMVFEIDMIEAAVMGAVLAAVSPAVIVPRMIKLSEEKYGTAKQIPQMILAGASVDDVFVIVMFSAFLGMSQGQNVSMFQFVRIPFSIAAGIFCGAGSGYLLGKYFERIHLRDTAKVMILLSVAFLFDFFESKFGRTVPFSSLIAVMGLGIGLQKKRIDVSKRLSAKFNKLWVFAEIVLFVLVGACVDINYTFHAGIRTLVLIAAVLIFRLAGVLVCVVKTELSFKERLFCVCGYIPKATVQAAIGGVPLAMGLDSGNIILSVAVVGILFTAPFGAFLIDSLHSKLLEKEN